ncbi:MAG TPA: hypothetical protein VMM58_08630 [Bacteroidota bacterium]|nr:hypothetical protein [Bacteroidota bacterium]
MKKILKHLLVALLLVSVILPVIPNSAASSSMTQNEMRLITGGKQSVDCGAVASTAEVLCYIVGGSSGLCSTIYGITYLGCVLSKIL